MIQVMRGDYGVAVAAAEHRARFVRRGAASVRLRRRHASAAELIVRRSETMVLHEAEPEPRAGAPTAHPIPGRPEHPRRSGLQHLLCIPEDAMVRIALYEVRRRERYRRTAVSSSRSSGRL
jgi:hypothetical protein